MLFRSILQNQIKNLSNSKGRHPQLFQVKFLGQLLHYAPHLESEIVSNYIEAGVRLYGTESKRTNVTNSVLNAIEQGKRQSLNNDTIEEIIRECNYKKTNIVVDSEHSSNVFTLTTKYLSEDKRIINRLIKECKIDKNKIIVTAPMGTGKTTLVKDLSNSINESVLFLAPLRSIVEQQSDSHIVLGETPSNEIRIAETHKLLFSTYASSHKLSSAKGKVLVIDESHLLSDRSNILYKEHKHLLKLINEAKSVVFLSATKIGRAHV